MQSEQLNLLKPVVAVTGPRPHKLARSRDLARVEQYVRARISEVLIELEPELVISGMALGVDQWAVEECVARKIPFIAAIPFEGQESEWTLEEQLHYHNLVALAWRSVIVSPGGAADEKYFVRNRHMVKSCDVLLAVWNSSMRGGTNFTVRFAKTLRKPMRVINPADALVTLPV